MTTRPAAPRKPRARSQARIDAILDAMPVAHIGHVVDGFPVVTPTLQWREGDRVYWHGSSASRMLEAVDDADFLGNFDELVGAYHLSGQIDA